MQIRDGSMRGFEHRTILILCFASQTSFEGELTKDNYSARQGFWLL